MNGLERLINTVVYDHTIAFMVIVLIVVVLLWVWTFRALMKRPAPDKFAYLWDDCTCERLHALFPEIDINCPVHGVNSPLHEAYWRDDQ